MKVALGSLKMALGTFTEKKNKLHCNVTMTNIDTLERGAVRNL